MNDVARFQSGVPGSSLAGSLPHYASVEDVIQRERPVLPVYCLFPQRFVEAAARFKNFPGDAMYAVKANPAPQVLDQVHAAGTRHFDTASLAEIELIRRRFPDAHCHFMAPVRIVGAAHTAFHQHGVTDYVVDCDFELDKLLAETGGGKGVCIFVRISTPLGGALLELSSKFGTTQEDAARLLKRVVEAGVTPGLTFHVGSQCLSPLSYAKAIEMARRTAELAGIEIAALDIGGGFPGPYHNNDVPPHHSYFDAIREALAILPGQPRLMCEPGRALIAEGVSVITQVVLRKGDTLYLNDGIYGSFDELTLPGWTADYPLRVFRIDGEGHAAVQPMGRTPFRVYGPTCDTLDVLPKPLMLPDDIRPGDHIVVDAIGAYSVALRTNFNGFFPDKWVIVGN
ncbi:MAG: type III PLP-dependent enzyme [Alphaproteobacteria bacterium]|nr:type III PLP-dependent enzyme [Alphaproteobacteria bacterium]